MTQLTEAWKAWAVTRCQRQLASELLRMQVETRMTDAAIGERLGLPPGWFPGLITGLVDGTVVDLDGLASAALAMGGVFEVKVVPIDYEEERGYDG